MLQANINNSTDTDTTERAFAKRRAISLNVNASNEKQKDGCPPIQFLPSIIQKLVLQLWHFYKFPIDFSLSTILFCISTVTGNNYRIRVKKKWLEIPSLYICLVSPPGATKSPVMNHFLDVLRKIDVERGEKYTNELKIYKANIKAASKDHPFEGEEPVLKQILLNDFTKEALVKALHVNPRGVGIVADELAGLFGSMNQYRKGNDVQFFLSLHNGITIVVNRKADGSFIINSPVASIIGGIQTDAIAGVFTYEMWSNGMGPRFIYCCPLGLKKQIAGDEELDPGVHEAYTDAIHFLHNIDNGTEPVCIGYEPDAKIELDRVRQQYADAVNAANDAGDQRLASILNKADYHIIRLSFVIQALHDAVKRKRPQSITLISVQGAAALTDYFMVHAGRVLDLVGSGNKTARKDEHQQFYEALPDTQFKFSEAVKIALELRPLPADKDVDTHKSTVIKWTERLLKDTERYTQPDRGKYIKVVKTT